MDDQTILPASNPVYRGRSREPIGRPPHRQCPAGPALASGMNIMTEPIRTIDEFAAEYHKTIGQELAFKPAKEANLDNIRRYGDGAGDYNPLYRNPGYAAKSRFGMVTAAPTFIYAVSLGVVAGETGNIDRARVSTRYLPVNYAGADIEFVRPIWLGDTVTATETVGDTMRKESKRIGSIQFNTGLVTYTNQRREVVATVKTLMARFENTGRTLRYDRAAAADQPEAPNIPADPLVWERDRQGATPLYWEDVAEGSAIPDLPKGTYTVSELFLFTPGILGTVRAKRAYLEAEDSADLGGGGRFDEQHAKQRRSMPGQFDYGPQRVCWLAQAVTDWMGDEGTLLRLNASIRHPNIVGDTNVVSGSVTRKWIDGEDHLAEVQVQNRNQAGLATALATATVRLPGSSRPGTGR